MLAGKSKVVMAGFRGGAPNDRRLGGERPTSIVAISSLNLLLLKAELVNLLGHFFRDHYPFSQSFSLSAEDWLQDLAAPASMVAGESGPQGCSLFTRRP